jgi:hypothetical protein
MNRGGFEDGLRRNAEETRKKRGEIAEKNRKHPQSLRLIAKSPLSFRFLSAFTANTPGNSG